MDEQLEVALKGGEYKRLFESQMGKIRQEHDLKKVDIEVLYFLSRCREENTPTDVYRRLKLNRGQVSQAIDTLCRRELIIAIPDKDDRRYMHYKTSETAEKIIKEIAAARKKLDRQIFKGISEEEIVIYKKITEKIFANIREMLEN